jgi:hypothetical protein
MSCREVEGEEPLEVGNGCNVVQLQPAGGARGRATAAREAPALSPVQLSPVQLSPVQDAVTRDGLDLLKAFFAIDDAAARAALVLMAQRLAQQSTKR